MIFFITCNLFSSHLLFLLLFLHFQCLEFSINLLNFILSILSILFCLFYFSKFIHHLLSCHFLYCNDLLSFLLVFVIFTLLL